MNELLWTFTEAELEGLRQEAEDMTDLETLEYYARAASIYTALRGQEIKKGEAPPALTGLIAGLVVGLQWERMRTLAQDADALQTVRDKLESERGEA